MQFVGLGDDWNATLPDTCKHSDDIDQVTAQ